MGTVTDISTRRVARVDARWPATIKVGDCGLMTGYVLDHSALGFFFVPEVSYLQGLIEGVAALDEIDAGEEVELSVISNGKKVISMRAVIRWLGYSQHHGVFGFGAELVAEAKIAA